MATDTLFFELNFTLTKHISKVFSIQKLVAVSQYYVSCKTNLVLLANVAHVEQFLVMIGKKLS